MRRLLFLILLAFPVAGHAQDIGRIVDTHILPRFQALVDTTAQLKAAALDDCSAESEPLHAAFSEALDAWTAASHLRFGPTETDDRAFALAFWPDTRGVTPRVLASLIADEDPIVFAPARYSDVSIAGRGFYALEMLLFDDRFTAQESPYTCALVRAVAADVSNVAVAINADWEGGYADAVLHPADDGPYRTDAEVKQELFKMLSTGLEVTSDLRLGRPLGTFDRPRPKRAEAWRSGRSERHVEISLNSLRELAVLLAADDPVLLDKLAVAFDRSDDKIAKLDDPVFAGVTDPTGRFKVEVLKQAIDSIRSVVRDDLGPTLGVSQGFNGLDGD